MQLCARKKFSKYFEINNLGEYDDLCVQSNALLLADVFENFEWIEDTSQFNEIFYEEF